jgi:hypothetical protein
MVNKTKIKQDKPYWDFLFNTIGFIVKSPYYLGKGIFNGIKYVKDKKGDNSEDKKDTNVIPKEKSEKQIKNITKKREAIDAKYQDFRIVKGDKKNYSKWYKKLVTSDSVIGILLGSRGSGKSAIGIKVLENMYTGHNKQCYAIGFREEEMPSWINVVENIEDIKNDSFVLIDEGGILFNSRNSMSDANKMLTELLLIARHKNLSILFISQNSSNLEINILRQADFLILKPSSLLQSNFERKIIQKMYNDAAEDFKTYQNDKGLAYIYSDDFNGFISNPLPSFWNTKISKSFSDQ